jgi:hypothetical protein
MARLNGIEPRQAGWFARLVYAMVRRKIAKITGNNRLVEPVKIMAHHGRLLLAYGQMEMGQEAVHSVPTALKSLASIMAASQVGCPF